MIVGGAAVGGAMVLFSRSSKGAGVSWKEEAVSLLNLEGGKREMEGGLLSWRGARPVDTGKIKVLSHEETMGGSLGHLPVNVDPYNPLCRQPPFCQILASSVSCLRRRIVGQGRLAGHRSHKAHGFAVNATLKLSPGSLMCLVSFGCILLAIQLARTSMPSPTRLIERHSLALRVFLLPPSLSSVVCAVL
jgi:hypothetical protein